MTKMMRLVVVAVALVAFAMAGVCSAADFYVVKDKDGKMAVVDKKPDDAKSVVKGPLKSKEEAEKALKEASAPKAGAATKKPVKLPTSGC